MSTREWLKFDTINQLINARQKQHGYKPLDDLDKVDIDRIGLIEKNVLRNNKKMTDCFVEWMVRVGIAYQEKYAGLETGEIEMSYWIRLQALAHTIVDREKDYPKLPEKLLWKKEETDSLDVMEPKPQDDEEEEEESDKLADQNKTLEERVADLEHLVHFLLKQKGHDDSDIIPSEKSIS